MKTIAISGSGRSGSTLVSLLLSQGEGVFNLGQLRHLAQAWAADAPCSCGQGVRSCPIYATAVPAGFPDDPDAGIAAFGRAATRFFKDAERQRHWDDDSLRETLRARHAGFLGDLTALLGAIASTAGAESFIDSSKLPEMALAFDLAQPGELRVLNLVRDPRAVAVSWHRRDPKLSLTLRRARVWRKRQRRLREWSRSLDGRFLRLRYEDFARNPEDEIASVLRWAAMEVPEGLFVTPERAHLEWAGQHLYPPANETVLAERLSDVAIRESEGWRASRHRGLRGIALALGWPEARFR